MVYAAYNMPVVMLGILGMGMVSRVAPSRPTFSF